MTAKRYILALLILALCPGAYAQGQHVYEAEREAQIQVSETWVMLAEAEAKYAEAWGQSLRYQYENPDDTPRDLPRMTGIHLGQYFADQMKAQADRMDKEAEQWRKHAGDMKVAIDEIIEPPGEPSESIKAMIKEKEHLATNFERAAALYRRAWGEYRTVSTEFEEME